MSNISPPQIRFVSQSETGSGAERSFKCLQCGTCCRWTGHVLLTEPDIARLAKASGRSEEEFIEHFTVLAVNRRQLSLADRPDGACILLDGNRCSLYEARPAQCRDFPRRWRVHSGCPALSRPPTPRPTGRKPALSVEPAARLPDNPAL